MQNSNSMTQQLLSAWDRAVVEGRLVNEFQADKEDAQGQWAKGDRIIFGIRQQEGRNRYYAHNLTQDSEIESDVEEREIEMPGPGRNFTCQFNGYRALRPGGSRKPLGRQVDISPAAADCRFFCQDGDRPLSLLARDPLLQKPLSHFIWKAYYNAAPIVPNGHFLWVPTQKQNELTHLLQVLTLPILEDAFALFQQLSGSLLFFNSLHSGASVNHIHFQSMMSDRLLPAETFPLTPQPNADYSIPKDYPAYLMVFEPDSSASRVFAHIDRLQNQGIPFNLMMTPRLIILVPRNIDFEIVSEFPGNGLAGLGMCGRLIVIDRDAYISADYTRIQSAFKKMSYCLSSS